MITGGVPIHPAREPLPTRVEGLPDLPIEYGRVLDAGLAELHLELDARARNAIDDQARLLISWSGAINLTAIREPAAIAVAHVLDSLTACGELRRRGIDAFLDLGSGAGYPGLPLAAALPATRAALVEPVGKKAAFLGTVVAATGLAAVEVLPVRAEALAADASRRAHLAVDLLEREHAEGDVARLVAHHVARDLLDERLVGFVKCIRPKAASARPSTMICMPR